jgi:DNA-binding MarR family transcriptional regulator/N-acetylglutamate synthase-like GNAT family acetyltransferase
MGCIAIASRFRRLAERMTQEATAIYNDQQLGFEARWFSVFFLLSCHAPISIMRVGSLLGITHSAVNQLAGEMIAAGLVTGVRDRTDKRRRLLALSAKGKALLPQMRPVWDRIYNLLETLLQEACPDLPASLLAFEQALAHTNVYERFYQTPVEAAIEILPYRPEWREAFKTLNLEWIEAYFTVEPEDQRILGDPEAHFLAQGGEIFFARERYPLEAGRLLGTCALVPKGDGVFELCKMAVCTEAQGRKIGKRLLTAALDWARTRQARTVLLESNTRLEAALKLYEHAGFVRVVDAQAAPSPYDRVDVHMRLDLNQV